jgi:hypothetical protein
LFFIVAAGVNMRLKKKKRVSSSSGLTSQSSTVDEDSRDSRDAERPMSWEGELSDSEMSRLDEAIVAGRGAIVAAAQANSLQVRFLIIITSRAIIIIIIKCVRIPSRVHVYYYYIRCGCLHDLLSPRKKTKADLAALVGWSSRRRGGPLSRLGHCANAYARVSFLLTTFQARSLLERTGK